MKNKEIAPKINRKRPFIILVFSLLLSLIAYVLGLAGGQDRLSKDSLRYNYNQLSNLENGNEEGKIYDNFLLPDFKLKVTRERYIEARNEAKTKEKFVKSDVEIHDVILRDNLGFIDRSIKRCLDKECINYKLERIYKKWAFIDGRWYSIGETTCIRKEPYAKSPEFERAISLIKQRYKQANLGFSNARGRVYGDDIYNCINIQYADLKSKGIGPEGIFYFDSQVSTIDNLQLKVDYSYQSKDDLLTAILLVHELTHAIQYLDKQVYNEEASCVDKESSAFSNGLILIINLNTEELNSLNSRLRTYAIAGGNSSLSSINELAKLQAESLSVCDRVGVDQNDCFWETVNEKIKDMVINNPYYQDQCGL